MKLKTQKRTSDAMRLPGAMALAAAGAATQANAATVQITFTGSYISNTGGNHIVTDFGVDGTDDIMGNSTFTQIVFNCYTVQNLAYVMKTSVGSGYVKLVAQVGTGARQSNIGNGPLSALVDGLVSFKFSDGNIRGGLQTQGYLDMSISAHHPGESRIVVNRLIFDDTTGGAITGLTANDAAYTTYGVPEPSSLGLLALGAGGLLTRRRRAAGAATKSA
jgi:hypothetical protein